MKRTSLFLLFFSVINLLFAQVSGDSFSKARSSRQATLTYVYEGIEGFSSEDESGNIVGLLVDVMDQFEQYVSDKHGIAVNTRYVKIPNQDFAQFLSRVQNASGGVFGISPCSIKEDRKSILKFSPAYLSNISVLITNNKVPTLSDMSTISQTFSTMKAYTVPQTTFADRVDALKSSSFSNLQVEYVPSMYEMVDNIAKDPSSFGFVDLNYYIDYLQEGRPIKRHSAGDLKGDEWGIIMPTNSDWQPVLTEFFNSGFLSSAEYRQMVIDNLGKWALRMIE